MVAPLAELGQHSGIFCVTDHALVRRRQDAVGHLSDLKRMGKAIGYRYSCVFAARGCYCHDAAA